MLKKYFLSFFVFIFAFCLLLSSCSKNKKPNIPQPGNEELTYSSENLENIGDEIDVELKNKNNVKFTSLSFDWDEIDNYCAIYQISYYQWKIKYTQLYNPGKENIKCTVDDGNGKLFEFNFSILEYAAGKLQFIKDLSFGFALQDDSRGMIYSGTFWIYNKVDYVTETKDNVDLNDYTYYCATCFHLTMGWGSSCRKLRIYPWTSFDFNPEVDFQSGDCNICNTSITDQGFISEIDQGTIIDNTGIDMSIFKINLNIVINSEYAYKDALKAKLDRLNNRGYANVDANNHCHINRFHNGEFKPSDQNKLICFGFPVFDGYWCPTYVYENGNSMQYVKFEHDIDYQGTKDYKTDLPTYTISNVNFCNKLGGGASGSILINEDLEICGILWGSIGISYFTTAVMFSCFYDSSNNINFFEQYR